MKNVQNQIFLRTVPVCVPGTVDGSGIERHLFLTPPKTERPQLESPPKQIATRYYYYCTSLFLIIVFMYF